MDSPDDAIMVPGELLVTVHSYLSSTAEHRIQKLASFLGVSIRGAVVGVARRTQYPSGTDASGTDATLPAPNRGMHNFNLRMTRLYVVGLVCINGANCISSSRTSVSP